MSAPSFAVATVASTKPRCLRYISATESASLMNFGEREGADIVDQRLCIRHPNRRCGVTARGPMTPRVQTAGDPQHDARPIRDG
jgi:hypothetical protein